MVISFIINSFKLAMKPTEALLNEPRDVDPIRRLNELKRQTGILWMKFEYLPTLLAKHGYNLIVQREHDKLSTTGYGRRKGDAKKQAAARMIDQLQPTIIAPTAPQAPDALHLFETLLDALGVPWRRQRTETSPAVDYLLIWHEPDKAWVRTCLDSSRRPGQSGELAQACQTYHIALVHLPLPRLKEGLSDRPQARYELRPQLLTSIREQLSEKLHQDPKLAGRP
jgi:hypothetical protein